MYIYKLVYFDDNEDRWETFLRHTERFDADEFTSMVKNACEFSYANPNLIIISMSCDRDSTVIGYLVDTYKFEVLSVSASAFVWEEDLYNKVRVGD